MNDEVARQQAFQPFIWWNGPSVFLCRFGDVCWIYPQCFPTVIGLWIYYWQLNSGKTNLLHESPNWWNCTRYFARRQGRSAVMYSHFWMLRRVQRGYACFDAYSRISLAVAAQQMLLVNLGQRLVNHFFYWMCNWVSLPQYVILPPPPSSHMGGFLVCL